MSFKDCCNFSSKHFHFLETYFTGKHDTLTLPLISLHPAIASNRDNILHLSSKRTIKLVKFRLLRFCSLS